MAVLAVPLKAWGQRFMAVLAVAAAVGLVLLGRIDPIAVERMRVAVIDAILPVIDVLSRPVEAARSSIDELESHLLVHAENERLIAENDQLRLASQRMRALEMQNAALRAQLNLVPDPQPRQITARVVADSASAFVRSVLIGAGSEHGVRPGQPVINGDGLVGRVVEVGGRSARVLLLSDLISRVPVQLHSTGGRAIVAGDNGQRLQLLYVPRNAQISAGDIVATSGHGGVFPPGLPVGTLADVSENRSIVIPFAELGRLDYVRVLDYGAEAIVPPPHGDDG